MKAIDFQTQSVSADATVSLSKKNNKKLFEQYVTPYSRLIYWMCIKHSTCRYYIEDSYQEVLTELYNCIHTYTPERGDIKTWICSVGRYTVWNMNRKHRGH